MTLEEFLAEGENLSRRAEVLATLHGYFRCHAPRLYATCNRFGLFSGRLGDVLEIGPFYGYTPFLLRPNSASCHVMEGDDPIVRPLEKLYRESGIRFSYVDFFDLFGPVHSAPNRLPLPDASCDTILCWETMEHFNFNPVKFVRELQRVLKPGGRACITVPNKTSLQNLHLLLTGRGEAHIVNTYFDNENYALNGKQAFYGFHWREYTPPELRQLFAMAGFKIEAAGSFTTFQEHGHCGPGRRLARMAMKTVTTFFPRYGTHAFVLAVK